MSQSTDMLYTFTGISGPQVLQMLQALVDRRGDVEAELLERLTRRPLESLAGFLVSASVAFYLAERGVNPRVNTFIDALYYISTCLSVGYADIFAQTQQGKLIAMLAMTVGPALTGNALDLPGHAAPASARGQEQILQRLDAILEELRKDQPAG